jgi:pimeloyl-ACP methyl ester carboxylesterase
MDYDKDFEDGFEYTSMGALHFMHHPGTKEKIIFLHGMGANTKVWSKLVQFLPDGLDVFLIDLLGHGKSDAPEMDYTVSNQFQALREFIAAQNNGNSFIFGHSYGGWIAAYYASQPYTCKGIILEDSAGLKETFDSIQKAGEQEFKDNMLKSLLAMNNNKDYVFRSLLDSQFREDQLTKDVMSDIKTKTKIIWGSNDTVLDKSLAQNFLNSIKGSTLSIIDGAGHDPHYTNPGDVAGIILQFMQQPD